MYNRQKINPTGAAAGHLSLLCDAYQVYGEVLGRQGGVEGGWAAEASRVGAATGEIGWNWEGKRGGGGTDDGKIS